jgi:hypothetical protein
VEVSTQPHYRKKVTELIADRTIVSERDEGTRALGPLLAVAAPVVLLLVGLAAFAPALTIQDFWLALVSGREIAEHGLPSVDHLTVMASGHHWVDQQWLAQLLLYESARIGGVGAAAAICLLAIATALFLTGHTAYSRGASPLAILVFLLAAVAAAPWGMQFRPQALALPLFALTIWLLVRDPDARRMSTLWVLPVLCVWANLHGSVVLGGLLVACYGLQALVRGAVGAARRRAVACVLLAPLALLASPYALSLPGYYRLMLIDPPFGREIREWHRTTPSAITAVFFALVAAAAVLAVTRRKRLSVFDALVLLLMLAVGLEALRGIVWFGLAAAALLPALATREPGSARLEGRAAGAIAVLVGLIGVGAIAWTAARPAVSYSNRYPPDLLRVVRTHTEQGHARVLADDASADWLLWNLPSLRGRVGYDVRFEILTKQQIEKLVVWSRLTRRWRAETQGYSVVVASPQHVTALLATGRWRRLYSSSRDDVAVRLAARKSRQP